MCPQGLGKVCCTSPHVGGCDRQGSAPLCSPFLFLMTMTTAPSVSLLATRPLRLDYTPPPAIPSQVSTELSPPPGPGSQGASLRAPKEAARLPSSGEGDKWVERIKVTLSTHTWAKIQ